MPRYLRKVNQDLLTDKHKEVLSALDEVLDLHGASIALSGYPSIQRIIDQRFNMKIGDLIQKVFPEIIEITEIPDAKAE